MKLIFKIMIISLAVGALTQTIVSAKVKTGDTNDSSKSQGSDGPGI
jgi:hypothetical protein